MNGAMTAEQHRQADAVARLERERVDVLRASRPAEPVAGMTHDEKAVRLARAAASLRR